MVDIFFKDCYLYCATFISFNVCFIFHGVDTLGCFKCVSSNGSDVHCSDPYHPINSTYVSHCFAGRQDRRGVFPGHFCYKIKGTHEYEKSKEELYVRDCSVEDLGNMCGQFEYQGKRMNGCILTCTLDGCNIGNNKNINLLQWFLFISFCQIVIFVFSSV